MRDLQSVCSPPWHLFYSCLTRGSVMIEKSTWWGCGSHIPSVLGGVPVKERCSCEPRVDVEGEKYPPMGTKADMLPGWVCKM